MRKVILIIVCLLVILAIYVLLTIYGIRLYVKKIKIDFSDINKITIIYNDFNVKDAPKLSIDITDEDEVNEILGYLKNKKKYAEERCECGQPYPGLFGEYEINFGNGTKFVFNKIDSYAAYYEDDKIFNTKIPEEVVAIVIKKINDELIND